MSALFRIATPHNRGRNQRRSSRRRHLPVPPARLLRNRRRPRRMSGRHWSFQWLLQRPLVALVWLFCHYLLFPLQTTASSSTTHPSVGRSIWPLCWIRLWVVLCSNWDRDRARDRHIL